MKTWSLLFAGKWQAKHSFARASFAVTPLLNWANPQPPVEANFRESLIRT